MHLPPIRSSEIVTAGRSIRRPACYVTLAVVSISFFCISVWGPGLLARNTGNPGPPDAVNKFPLPPVPARSPEDSLKTFKIQDGLSIECVASEPLVEDPVSISFDEQGRMWVVEMRGFMNDIDGLGENQPNGRIKILERSPGSATYDKATVFLDNLVMPRAVLPVRGGALVAEPPYLHFWQDSDGDGKADKRTVVADNYGSKKAQPEYMPNNLTMDLDNWIYSAMHGNRIRYREGKWITEPTRPRGQWGLSQDDYGRLYYNYNGDLLRADLLPVRYFSRNPLQPFLTSINCRVLWDQQVWPSHKTPGINRGYNGDSLRENGTLTDVTASCGPSIYRGDLLPEAFHSNAFVPEPAANLVKRVIIEDSNGSLSGTNAYERSEFLTSTDERFRPVNTCTGPDGALYIVDMYRGIIQHESYLSDYLIRNINERNLTLPVHYGRIYRIAPADKPFSSSRLGLPHQPEDLVALLGDANGWMRDTAQRLLTEMSDPKEVTALLEKMALSGENPLGRLHALWTLEGVARLTPASVISALRDRDGKVRAAAVRLSEPFLAPATREQILPELGKLASDPDPDVQLQLLLSLGAMEAPSAIGTISTVLGRSAVPPRLLSDALLSGLRGRELEFLEALLANPDWSIHSALHAKILYGLAECIFAEHKPSRVARLIRAVAAQKDAWRRESLLEGIAASAPPVSKNKNAPTPPRSLIYLESEPAELASLLDGSNRKVATLATELSSRLAWPGKPGVPPPPVVKPLNSDQLEAFQLGKTLFTNICAGCHQPSGLGQEGLAPPLVDSEWVLGKEERLIRILLHGLTGPVTVSGRSFNLEMPALGALNDQEIAAVLTYIRREWEHTASPVEPNRVKTLRAQFVSRPNPWSVEELVK